MELPDDLRPTTPSPLEEAVQAEAYQRYRTALGRSSPRDRELVVARDRGAVDATDEIASASACATRRRGAHGRRARAQPADDDCTCKSSLTPPERQPLAR